MDLEGAAEVGVRSVSERRRCQRRSRFGRFGHVVSPANFATGMPYNSLGGGVNVVSLMHGRGSRHADMRSRWMSRRRRRRLQRRVPRPRPTRGARLIPGRGRCPLRAWFDPSYGQAMSTYLYRVMRRRYPDFLRTTLGDNRSRGRGRRVPAGARFPLRELEGAVWDDNSGGLDEALATLGENLSEESRTTIREVAVPLAAGWKMPELAVALEVRQMDIEQRLERLREELGAVHEPAQSGHVVAAS